MLEDMGDACGVLRKSAKGDQKGIVVVLRCKMQMSRAAARMPVALDADAERLYELFIKLLERVVH